MINHSARASWVHDQRSHYIVIEEYSSPASARGRHNFVLYADKIVAQLNGCASSTSQAYVGPTYALTTLLGGPFHSGAPRLCLSCLPCRDAINGSVIQCGSRCLILHKYEVICCEHVFNEVTCGTIVVVVSTQW